MPPRELVWRIPLDAKPAIYQVGMGIHGPNQVRSYFFPEYWCVHLYRYEGDLYLNGRHLPIRPGSAGIIPPGMINEYHHPHARSIHIFAHFHLPDLPDSERVPIRAMQELGNDFIPFNREIERALDFFSSRVRRAEVILWELLWQLAERTPSEPGQPPRHHPAVQRAMQLIDLRLTEPLRVTDLAHEVDMSHNHLTRLFHDNLGTTVTGYIQARRMQRAEHLLLHSTLPIKAVAVEVGIPDLHLFNKMVRRALGDAPSRIRTRGGGVSSSFLSDRF